MSSYHCIAIVMFLQGGSSCLEIFQRVVWTDCFSNDCKEPERESRSCRWGNQAAAKSRQNIWAGRRVLTAPVQTCNGRVAYRHRWQWQSAEVCIVSDQWSHQLDLVFWSEESITCFMWSKETMSEWWVKESEVKLLLELNYIFLEGGFVLHCFFAWVLMLTNIL